MTYIEYLLSPAMNWNKSVRIEEANIERLIKVRKVV
jgi:hypothetical protein